METQTTDTSQALPQTVSDAAWKSMLPFLKAFPNIYVGNPETCTLSLGDRLDDQRGSELARPAESLWILEHDLPPVREMVRCGGL